MYDEPLRFSKFTHLFKKDKTMAMLHALKLRTVFLDKPLFLMVQEFEGGAVPDKILNRIQNKESQDNLKQLILRLKELEILVPIRYNEMSVLQEIQKFNLRVSIGIIYLLLTDQCNFRCDYCYVENAIPPFYKFSKMPKEVAKSALDFFAECIIRNPTDFQSKEKSIIFYGGEPLLNKETFKFALEYIQILKSNTKLPQRLKIALNTNGSLIDEEIAELIVVHGVQPSISLDGPRKIHDQLRRNHYGKGTFDEALRGYKILREKKIPVSISCTIGPHNIEKLEDVFKWFKDELDVRGMGFNLLVDDSDFGCDMEYAKKVTQKIIRCYEIARSFGIYEDRIMRKVKAFVDRKPHLIDCGGCGRQIVISPDGKIGICQAYIGSKKYFVGAIAEKPDPFNEPGFIEWSKRSPINMPQCFDCEALGICGGGCAYNADIKNGSIWTLDKAFCIHSREILRWLIWDLYENITKKGGDKDGKGMVYP